MLLNLPILWAMVRQRHEWFYELTRQTHKLRFVATGGALKNILKDDDLTDEKMVNTGENDNDEKTDEKRLNFTYYKSKKGYIYNPEFNE